MATPRPALPARPSGAAANGTPAPSPAPSPAARIILAGSPMPKKDEYAALPVDSRLEHAEQVALWTEVGLETDQSAGAVHNYAPETFELPAVELRALNDEFTAHRKLFGFQADNVRNQMEHICFLIQNARDRYGAAAYQYLHNRFFSNYRRWCSHINAQRWCFQKCIKHAFDSPSYGERNKIQDLVLWLLIWGEAANMRHTPEFLCFLFYRMSNERQRVIDSGVIDRDHTTDEWFRCHVIEPAYNIAFAMQQYQRNNGTLKDHQKRPNYDDINEYFWNRRWLDHMKNYHDEDLQKFWGLKYNKGFLIDLDAKTGRVVVQREGSVADRKKKDDARRTLKTFPEKRSWLNLFRSFFRIVELHFFALHILILFGYGYVQSGNKHQIATCVLTPSALAVLLELVEFVFYWGVIASQGLLLNFLLRLCVYSAVFIVLGYLYLANVSFFWYVAILYLALRVLWELFNVTTHRWIRKWHMSEDRNFESDVATQLSISRRVGSTIFWIVIFIGKCFYSYYTYIKPIIQLTTTLREIPGWVGEAGIGPDNSSSLSNWLLIVLLWVPTIIMFLIDTQIFFSTSIVFLGIVIGVRDRVCNIRSYDDIEHSFTDSWRNGARKFFGQDTTVQLGVSVEVPQNKGPLNLPPLISPPWHLIQVMWSEIVSEMRAADHASYHDEQLLNFGHFTYIDSQKQVQETFFLPPFVTAGQMGSFIEMLGELQDSKDRRLGGLSMILREIKSQLKTNETMRTALDEVYIAGTLLLQTFIPTSSVAFDISNGNRLLEYTCRQKKPHSFIKDVMTCLEKTVTDCVALCFDKGHQNIIRKPPSISSITQAQEDSVASGPLKLPEVVNSSAFQASLQQLYKFWIMIAEGSGPELLNDPDKAASGAALASNVAPGVIDLTVVDNLAKNDLASLLCTIYHLLSTANVDARPQSRNVTDRLMFFLSSLNTRMPERQNSVKEMYSWTVLTPYVEELVIYTPEELELPNAEGITADFYLKTTHKKEWMAFLERMASDPLGGDPAYRLVQKREWCSFRGQTLLRTVRGMMTHEKAIKILSLLEQAKGSHWTASQERAAKQISQRKFTYVLSCQKYGAFKAARARRDRGELIDKPNLPDGVRLERKRLLDEAQKADDIEYILRKYPHLRVAYVDDATVDGQKVYSSVLIKAVVRREDDGMPLSATAVLGRIKGSRRDALLARARAEQSRQEELLGDGMGISSGMGLQQQQQGAEVGSGCMVEDVEADKAVSFTALQLKPEPTPEQLQHGHGGDASDIQEIYRVRLPGAILIGEGKPENQNHALVFTRGEMLECIDMNQDGTLEEAFKMRNLLEEFDPLRAPDSKVHRDELKRPTPILQGSNGVKASANGVLKCAILGFRETIFTAGLMSVGTYMSLMEATFVSLTLRTFAWLGSRMHYGHPDCMDKVFFMTRGGISKSSKMIHVSEDIFAGFKSTLRGGRINHVEYVQCGKGRDLGFNQLFLFEAKLASGAGEQALSREAYRLGRYLDLPRLLSFFYGSIGFYTTTALIVVSIATLLFANMMIALTGVDQRVNEFNSQFGVSVGLLHASSVYQLGLLLIIPMLAEIALEKTFMKAVTTLIWMLITGAPFFFFFHTQTKAFFFNNSIMYGGAKYRATGRGFALSRDSFTRIYRTYARSHIYPAMKFLFMMIVFGIFSRSGINWFVEMWAPLLLVIAWLYAPMWFNPLAFEHDKVMADFGEWRKWLDRKSMNEELSWTGWWVAETEYLNRTPSSTKFWLTIFNIVIPILIIAASISALDAGSYSRIYFLIVSIGVTVGLALISIFLVHQCHPVGDTYRWLKFFMCLIIVALLVFTVIFDTGSESFGFKGINFVVYLITMSLSVNAVCKVLMIHGAGPYRFGFCMTWFKYCDVLFGLIVYGPWIIFSFIGLASIQTRLLYNRAFFHGMRVGELLRGDPSRKEKYKQRTAVISKQMGPGYTPMGGMTRENSDGDLLRHGQPRSGMNLQVPEHSYSNRSKNYSHAASNSPTTSQPSSRRGSLDSGPETHGLLARSGSGAHDAPAGNPNPHLLIYSQSPSSVHAAPPLPQSARPHPLHISSTPQYRPNSAGGSRPANADEEKQQAAGQPRYTYN